MTTRRTAALLAALVVVPSCGESESPRIVIEGAPHISIAEGETHLARITIDPPPAAPLDLSDFVLDLGDADQGVFARAELVEPDGVLSLALTPRCDVIAPRGRDALASLLVRGAAGTSVEPADTAVQIGESPGAPCSPRVVAWTGDCSTPPSTAELAVTVPAGTTELCLWIENRDTTNERLWIRTQTDAPPTLLAAAQLPNADEVADSPPAAITLGNTTDIRGVFRVDYQLYRADPSVSPVAATVGAITLTVGEPGTSIEVTKAPASTPEFSVGDTELNVWHLSSPAQDAQTCARAVLVDPTAGVDTRTNAVRSKATVRLYNNAGTAVDVDTWMCGQSFRLAYSPPVDARATETVRVEAATCDCTGDAIPATAVVTYDAAFPVDSMAETLPCDVAFNPSDKVDIACADLDGDADTTPDVVIRTADTLCVFGGDAGRHTMLSSETLGVGAGPKTFHSLMQQTPTGPAPLIIAAERVSGLTHRMVQLRLATVIGQPPTWQAFSPLADVTRALPHLIGVAPQANAASTYIGYMVPLGPNLGVRLRCIDEANCCTGPGVCDQTQVAVSDLGAQESIAALAPVDVDGDGVDEVVLFTFDEATGTKRLHVRVLPVSWNAGTPSLSAGPFSRIGGITIVGSKLKIAVPEPTCPAPPCAESAYAVPVSVTGDARLYKLRGGATPSLSSIQTPSIALDIVEVGSNVVTGLDFGLFEGLVTANLGILAWTMQDPVLRETSVAGVIQSPAPGYGSRVARCLGTGSESSVVVAATLGTARYTKLSLDVSEP